MRETTRRLFCQSAGAALLSAQTALRADTRAAMARRPAEWSFESGKKYGDPFRDVTLDVAVSDSKGKEAVVPAYWAGEQTWRVRYAAPAAGQYKFKTRCNDESNRDLHGITGTLEVSAYEGDNPLYRHGPLRVAANKRYLEHADGAPFFWLGDTWWMGLATRFRWPEDFQRLTADRLRKGFSVIQIIAGLYPDMPSDFDPRSANEAGFAWKQGYQGINPAYFDMADLRIQYLVESGLMPCIVGCWGYYLPVMGMEKIQQHWRYLVARWGAYPVVWCLAGEGSMPFYLSEDKDKDKKTQETGWSEMGRYLRKIDPYQHAITIHPSASSRATVSDPSVLDFEMLQTGHSGYKSIPRTIELVRQAYDAKPVMPVLNSEVCYEGILNGSREDVQRFMFWSCILSGACGHTYGANGIWQMNTKEQPFGPSPHGRNWGNTPWDIAAQYPGSKQLGLGAKLLRRYPWQRFEPHPEWVLPANGSSWSAAGAAENFERPYAAGIPGELRMIYMPMLWDPPRIVKLEQGVSYGAMLFNPQSGEEHDLGAVKASQAGEWQMPIPPEQHDWVIVLKKA
jgi:hypothetical protein